MSYYQVVINTGCNLRCSYCYEHLDKKSNNSENIIKSLEVLIENDNTNNKLTDDLIIDIIGGEPFIYPDMLDEVMDWVLNNYKRWGFKSLTYTITTNGTLLNKPKQKKLLEKYKKFIVISVSIDGNKEVHDLHRLTIVGTGSFDDALEGYKTALSILGNEVVLLRNTQSKSTIRFFSRSVKYLLSLNSKRVSTGFVYEDSYSWIDGINLSHQYLDIVDYIFKFKPISEYRDLTEKINTNPTYNPMLQLTSGRKQRNGCYACDKAFTIGYNGTIYGCNRFMSLGDKSLPIGVINDGKYTPSNTSVTNSIVSAYNDFNDSCAGCYFLSTCDDCVAVAYESGISYQDYYSEKRRCGTTKAKEIAVLYYSLLSLKEEI